MANPVTRDYMLGGCQIDPTRGCIAAVHAGGVVQVLDVKSRTSERSAAGEQSHETPRLQMMVMTGIGVEKWVDLADPNIRVLWVEQEGKRFTA